MTAAYGIGFTELYYRTPMDDYERLLDELTIIQQAQQEV